eukprot:TRINITY_DN16069_c0_g1_i1.p1 TRINITY_DN16069_c0_g1~~TRINITY_DN16069_c0_g1_i1.p1  ORF type:complete len:696 (+),score=295.56 TRINITY_DN16069_c0_g1_i1:185-2272(+)
MEFGSATGGLFENAHVDANQPKQSHSDHLERHAAVSPVMSSTRGMSPSKSTGSPRKKGGVVPPEFARAINLDLTGLEEEGIKSSAVEKVAAECGAEPAGLNSLANIDIDTFANDFYVLDSPRSIQACLKKGIQPAELVHIPLEHFLRDKGMGRDKLSTTLRECAQLEYDHQEQRRRQKFHTLLAERERVIENTAAFTQSVSMVGRRRGSEMLRIEEHKMKKTMDANHAMIRQRIAHETKIAKYKEDKDKQLQAQREVDEQAKLMQRKAEAQREAEAELRTKLINMKKKLEKREAQALLVKKQKLIRQKENEREEQRLAQKREKETENQARAEANAERQAMIKMQNHLMIEDRRDELLSRIERNERIRQEIEAKREEALRQRKEASKAKQEKIQSALERHSKMRELKILKALEKEERANEALDDFERARMKLVMDRRKEEEQKTLKRAQVYQEAQDRLQEKTDEILQKCQVKDKYFQELKKKQHNDFIVRSAQRKLKVNDKVENVKRMRKVTEYKKYLVVEKLKKKQHNDFIVRSAQRKLKVNDKVENVKRMRKVTEYKKYLVVEKIEEKNQKVEDITKEKMLLKEKIKGHREALDAVRVPINRQSPGPGDYLGIDPLTTKHTPMWKFGASAPHHAMRVIEAEHCKVARSAPGYVASPGPCAYSPDVEKNEKKRPPCFSIPRSDRWKQPVGMASTM